MGMPGQVQPYPAVALGSFEATPLEMATAYNVLANGGLKVEPVTVLSVADEKREAAGAALRRSRRAWCAPESAFLVVQHDAQRAQQRHRRRRAWAMGLPRGIDVAGKTGTTNDMRDAWFVGLHARPAVRGLGGLRRQLARQPLRRAGRAAHLGGLHEGRAGGRAAGALPGARPPTSSSWTIDPTTGLLATPALPEDDLGGVRRRHRAAGVLLVARRGLVPAPTPTPAATPPSRPW